MPLGKNIGHFPVQEGACRGPGIWVSRSGKVPDRHSPNPVPTHDKHSPTASSLKWAVCSDASLCNRHLSCFM